MKLNLHFLIIVGFLSISYISLAQGKIIQRPDYESSSTTNFQIDKLELKNTETILHCDIYSNNWMLLSSKIYLKGKSGKLYKLLRSEGFELDKQVTMPQSGNISFKLHMEPLDKTEKSFDYIEGENENMDKITNIKTYKAKPANAPIRCLLKGQVTNRPQCSRIILSRLGEDVRISAISIPIRNGKFEYELNCKDMEAYQLVFGDEYQSGGYRAVSFFAEPGIVSFNLFSMEAYDKNTVNGPKSITLSNDEIKPLYQENKVTGGLLNSEYARYNLSIKSLFNVDTLARKENQLEKENKYYSQTVIELDKLLETTKDEKVSDSLIILKNNYINNSSGIGYSPETNALFKQGEIISRKREEWEMNYIRKQHSIVSYSLLMQKLDFALSWYDSYKEFKVPERQEKMKNQILECIDLFNTIYAKKYPNHPYTREMGIKVTSFSTIKVGGSYKDFTAPDFAGKQVKLSEQINGKVALIDLWASWCGPCRKRAKSIIPVYEVYKDKGFTVVGVARENALSNGVKAAEKDKYPWINLIELKDAGKIWSKYGIDNAGGSTFLVDKNGIILAINPTDDEVRVILEKLLN